eukprot:9557104-Alexandrium_andersonii.AAC.1
MPSEFTGTHPPWAPRAPPRHTHTQLEGVGDQVSRTRAAPEGLQGRVYNGSSRFQQVPAGSSRFQQ